jgi:hypothetical protein
MVAVDGTLGPKARVVELVNAGGASADRDTVTWFPLPSVSGMLLET